MTIKILIVDDDKDLLILMQRFLMKEYPDIEVVSAVSAQDSLRRLEMEQFDAIVCDFYLGPKEMNGLELLEWLRTSDLQIPFIMFTGRSREEVAIRALNLGADFYLKKDVDDFENLFRELIHHIKSTVETRQIEDALAESEERFRAMFESAPIGVARVSPEGSILEANASLTQMLEYEMGELVGLNVFDLTLPEDEELERQLSQEMLQGLRDSYQMEKRFVRKSGKLMWGRLSVSVVLNKRGEPIFTIGMVEDVTELKEEREALRESEARFRALYEEAGIGITLTVGDTIVDVNPAYANLLGYSREELSKMNIRDISNQEDHEIDRQLYVDTIEQGHNTYDMRKRYKHKDGSQIWVDLTVSVVRNEDGEPTFMFGMVQDVSEQVKMVDTIKENEQRFREIFEQSPIAIELFDPEGNLLDANSAALATFGLDSIEDFLGFNLFKDPNIPERYMDELRSGSITRYEVEFDFNWVAKHKMYETSKTGTIHLAVLHTPLKSAAGSTITGYLTQIQDISERKEAEERYQTLFDEAPLALAATDSEGRIIEANQSMLSLTGHTNEELKGNDVGILYSSPQEREQASKTLDDVKTLRDFEATLTRKDGTVFDALLDIDLRGDQTLVAIRDITERKNIEKALMQSEEIQRSMIKLSPDVIVSVDTEGIVISCSDAIETLTGYGPETMIGLDYKNVPFLPQDELHKYSESFAQILSEKKPTSIETTFVHKDGSPKTAEVRIGLIIIDGEVYGAQAIVTDITERKQTDFAIKESEEKYRSLFENILNGHAYCRIVTDDKGKPIDWIYLEINDSFEKLTGLKRSDVLGKRVTEAIPGIMEETPELFDIYGKVAQTGEPAEFEIDFTPLDIWLKISVTSPKRGYFVAIFANITDSKKAEMALKESEERFRSVFEESAIANNLYDANGLLIAANQAGVEMFGVSSVDDLLGFNLFEDPNLPKGVAERILAGETVRVQARFDFDKVIEDNLYPTTKSGIRYYDTVFAPFGLKDDGSVEGYYVQLLDVTVITEAQQALRKSEVQFRAVFENAGIGMTIVSSEEKRLIASNPALRKILGYSEKEMAKMHIPDFSHPDDMEKDSKLTEEALEAGTDMYQMEKRFFHKDGSIVWGNLRVTIVMGEDDSPTYFIGMVEDITARKMVELALSESEEKYRSLFDYSPYPIVVSDIQTGKIVDFNDKTLEMLGYTREEFQKIEIHEFDALEEEEDVAARLREIKETGGIQFESKHITKNKEIRDVLVSTRLTTSGDKTLNQAVIIDITDQKRTEEALRESEMKYRSLWENSVTGLAYLELVTDDEGQPIDSILQDVNPSFIEMIGQRKEDVIGNRFDKAKHGFQKTDFDPSPMFWKVALTGEPTSFEFFSPVTERWFAVSVYSPSHRTFVCALQDMTSRKLIEQELRESETRLKQAQHIAKMGFMTVDLKTNDILWSDEVYNIYGVVKEKVDVTLDYTISLVHPDDIDFVQENLDAALNDTKEYDIDHRMVRPNGEIIWVHAQAELLRDSNGTPTILFGSVVDITDRKQAEESLKESEGRFRGLFEKSPIGIELYDREGLLIDANQVVLDIFGVSSVDDVKGLNLFEDPNLTEEAKNNLRKGRSLAFQAEFDFELVKKNNLYGTSKSGTFPMDVLISPMILGGGDETDAYIVHVRDISDRKIAEDALKESEKKLRDFFRNAQVSLFRTDLNTGVILDCNDRAAELLGYDSPRDMIRKVKAPDHYIDPESRRKLTEELSSEGEIQIYETQLKKVNGEELWVEISATNYPLEGYVESAVIDVTERKTAEMALKESEANLRSIFEQAAVGVARVGLSGSIIEANWKLKQILGYDESSLEGVNVFEITPEEDSELEKQLSDELIAGKRDSYSMEKRFIRKDGSIIWGRLTVSVSRTSLGDINFTIGVLEDITEEKQLQETLQMSEERFRSIVENAGVGITIVDMEDHILEANQKYQNLVGFNLDELKQMTISEFTYPEDAEKDKTFFDEVMDGKSDGFQMEKRYIRKDGEQIWVDLTTSVLRNKEGAIDLTISIIQDITDRKEAFKLIEQQRKELSDFAHMISHDLNNNFIKLRLMLNELETEDNRSQTDKIGNLLIDMSELTKHSIKLADAGLAIGARQVVDIGENIRETAELHVPSEIEFIENLSLVAKADETKISQVLVNILENAVVHGRPKRIEVSSAVVSGGVNLTVANDGIQIPQDIRPKIFDYGFSSEEVRRGLGLSYVKKLIEAHGWTITLRDTRETAFVIYIPQKDLQI